MALPLVAIIGRPNVGKSALFNRILGQRRAIVDRTAALTRDRLYAEAEWRGRRFTLVDTAGLVLGKDRDEIPGQRELRRRMEQQTQLAIEEADCVLFVLDVRDGLTAIDRDIAERVRRARPPVLLVANKSDGRREASLVHEFYELGLGEPWPVSALHGTGSGDLLDAVVRALPPAEPMAVGQPTAARVAILGRPNVGKSSLLNAFLGDERSLVAPEPGTTRDPVDTEMQFEGKRVLLVDTAGIRRPGLTRGVEQYSLLRGLRAMERSDVALLVLDARDGVTAQDLHIAGYATEAGRGIVLVVNKWDLVPPDEKDERVWRKRMRQAFDFASWAPVAYVSAKTRLRVTEPLQLSLRVVEERRRRIATPELNRWLGALLAEREPPTRKGKRLSLFYVTQAEAETPTFIFFVNEPELVHFSFHRFLEGRLRKAFDFQGTPVRLLFRPRRERGRAHGH